MTSSPLICESDDRASVRDPVIGLRRDFKAHDRQHEHGSRRPDESRLLQLSGTWPEIIEPEDPLSVLPDRPAFLQESPDSLVCVGGRHQLLQVDLFDLRQLDANPESPSSPGLPAPQIAGWTPNAAATGPLPIHAQLRWGRRPPTHPRDRCSRASGAATVRPDRHSSSARARPMRSGRTIDASGGKTPSAISGCPNAAVVVANTR